MRDKKREKMKILITGRRSFIGTNYKQYSRFANIDEVSVSEQDADKIVFSGYDVVLHLAALVHRKKKIPEHEYFRVNHSMSLKLAQSAKKEGVKHFIFLSTVKVYGETNSGRGVWNEISECKPADAYAKSKLAAEKALMKLEDESFTVAIIRTPVVYGAGVRANMLDIVKLIDKSKVLPFGNVGNRRNFTSVENLAAYIDRIIEMRASGIFIAMDNEAISTTELVQMISSGLGKHRILLNMPGFLLWSGALLFPGFYESLFGSCELDNSATLKKLDFKPPLTTREGIGRMIMSMKA
jgi:nucleoside-diphosphate-sugar epimerase